MSASRMPSMYLPHGGGPSFFMSGPRKARYQATEDFLRGLHALLPARPEAILLVSGAGSDAGACRLWRGMVGPSCLGAWAFAQA